MWLDANRATVPVLGVLSIAPVQGNLRQLGTTTTLLVADSRGFIWASDAVTSYTTPVASAQIVFFASNDCTGTGYVAYPPMPRAVFTVPTDALYHAIPDSFAPSSLVAHSYFVGSCGTDPSGFGGSGTFAPIPVTLPSVPISQPAPFAVPLHPEIAP